MVDDKSTALAAADSLRRIVNQTPRELDTVRRDDRTAIAALLIEIHRRRTHSAAWTGREQLLLEYVFAWADGLEPDAAP